MANAILGSLLPPPAQFQSGLRTVYRQDLPAVNLTGWQVTFLELSFPAGLIAPSHRHPGFVLGYVLEGKYRLHVEGAPEAVLSAGDVFYEPPGRVHLPSGSASATRSAKVLAIAFSEKGKELVAPA
jgi:quercetin dioxygenase-like cupin family protein